MTPRMFFLTIVICVLSLAAGFSQNKSNIYPLRSELKKVGALQKQEGYKPSPSMDSTRTRILNGTALEYLNFNPDSGILKTLFILCVYFMYKNYQINCNPKLKFLSAMRIFSRSRGLFRSYFFARYYSQNSLIG